VNEVQYLFKHFGLDSPLHAEQEALARQMIRYWGSFVRDGVPPDSRRCRTDRACCCRCARRRTAATP
jgi:hypothetical protein